MLKAEQIDKLFRLLNKSIETPVTALNYGSEFQLLIAVMLSAQATDVSVNQVTPGLFAIAPSPEKMLELGRAGLEQLVRRIGLYKTKSANILNTCKALIECHNSRVPDTREALEKLPGVGRKTAGVVLNVAFGKPEIPVDTHVFRVANRMGLAAAKTPLETEQQLMTVVPDWIKLKAHHLLILHGRHVCKARKPLCSGCPVIMICQFQEKNLEQPH